MKSGGTIPVTRTQSTIPADLVQNVMRLPYRERFTLIINELGTGLAGRPEDLSAVIHRADLGLQQTSRVLKILGDQNKIIQNFIVNSDTVMQQLDFNYDLYGMSSAEILQLLPPEFDGWRPARSAGAQLALQARA